MLAGRDVADNDANTNPPNATFNHGSHCAGIAAAATNNGIGIASLNYPVGGINYLKIIPVKVTSDANPNPGNITHGYEGIRWAADNGAKVISCSWGGPAPSPSLQYIIDYAYGKGCIIVAAAGNSGINELNYPASYNHVISVGATDNGDVKASFSTYSNAVDVMAPGVGIYSTFSNADNVSYGTLNGTSMACPLTAGLVGLMWSFNPNLTQSTLEACLKSSCTNITPQNPGLGGLIGSGRINASQALACVGGQTIFADFTSNITRVCSGQTVNFTDLTGGNVTSWLWNFGDGTANSTLKNPSHIYNGAVGTVYTVSLTSTGPGGNNTIVRNAYITVATPSAQIVGQGATTVCDNSLQAINLQFSGNPPFSVTFSNGIIISNLQSLNTTAIVSVKQGDSPLKITSMTDAGCTGTVVPGQAVFIFVACCPNILTNGDFEAGNTLTKPTGTDLNFSTTYSPSNYNVYNATTNSVGNWPMRPTLPNRGLNMAYDGYGSNTPIYDPPLVPNTVPIPHTRVWCQTVNIAANTNYDIQFFTTDNALATYGKLEFQVRLYDAANGIRFIGTPINIPPSNTLNWHQSNVSYSSPVTLTNEEVCICQVNSHNTFAYDLYLDDITMRPNIPATINAGPDISICLGEGTVIGTPLQAGLTYQWTPTTGLSNPTIAQPTASPAATTVYTLVVTNPITGCQSRDEVTVIVKTNCCVGAWNAPATISTNTTIASPAFANASVNQNLTITAGTLTFSNINVLMATNVKITVNSGAKLVITRSAYLHACSQMWDGIYVEAGGEVDIDSNALVEDAKNVIVSNNGGKYVLNGAILNKNLVGIQVNSLNATHTGTIINSIITSRSLPISPKVIDLKTTNPLISNAQSVLKIPYSNRKGCYGINVTDVTNITIGSAITASNLNIFDWIMCGINLTRSNALIYNNQFQYLLGYNAVACPGGGGQGQPPPPCYYEAGYGIKTSGTANTGTNSITIGGTNTNQANIFINIFGAILTQNYQAHTIIGNNITNSTTGPFSIGVNYGRYGVYISSPTSNNTINISNNTLIKNCETGIWVNRSNLNALQTTSLTIQNNGDVNVPTPCITADANGYCKTGIYVSDLSTSSTPASGVWSISNNAISEATTGISLLNVKKPAGAPYNFQVTYNSIKTRYATTGNTNGIMAKGCNSVEITANHTNYTIPVAHPYSYETNGNLLAYGIYLQNSSNMLVSCNTVERAARSMVFQNNCLSSALANTHVGVFSNTMSRAQDGFVLLTSGIIGQQGDASIMASDNKWDLTTTPTTFTRSQTYADVSDANSSVLYVHNTPATLPTTNLANPAFPYSSTSLLITTGGANGCGGVPPALMVQTQNTSVSNTTSYGNELKTIAQDTKPLPAYSDAVHWERNRFVYNEVKNNPALSKNNTALQNFYTKNTSGTIGKLASIEDKIATRDYAGANSINTGVKPVLTMEQNQQTINDLILRKLLNVNYIYSDGDKTTLSSIANQCPIDGGNAVYQARVLLMTINNTVIDFVDNCNVVAGRSMEEPPIDTTLSNHQTITSSNYKLYPNPNNGNMLLDYTLNEGEVGIIKIYDLTGKLICSYRLNANNSQLQINNADLNNGIYIYHITVNNTIVKSDKLVIIK